MIGRVVLVGYDDLAAEQAMAVLAFEPFDAVQLRIELGLHVQMHPS